MQVPQARVATGKAASRTVRKRSHSLANVRLAVAAGDTTAQLAHELHAERRADRAKLLEELRKADRDFHIRIPVRDSLALKADLNLPWNQLRTIRR